MSRIALIVGVAMSLLASTSLACIFASEADRRQEVAEDIAVQRNMVRHLAIEADTILIAFAMKPDGRDRILFRIDRTLKGTIIPSQRASYAWRAGVGTTCFASEAFLNINPWEGQTYILYAKDGQLLRAGDIKRYGLDISLEEEITLVTAARDI